DKLGLNHQACRNCWITAMEASLALGDLEEADRVYGIAASLPDGHVYPFLRAQMRRFRAQLAAAREDPETAEAEFRAAAASLGDLRCVFDRAVVQTEHLEWLDRRGRGADDDAVRLEAEARGVFESLGATAWLERLDQATATSGAAQPIG
ncbi:MAG TPA: hypothetical protein VNN79_06615, partial [Actinomycetota bacterium]|nr:hypothetical protein [Actinomycetota bacterium]